MCIRDSPKTPKAILEIIVSNSMQIRINIIAVGCRNTVSIFFPCHHLHGQVPSESVNHFRHLPTYPFLSCIECNEGCAECTSTAKDGCTKCTANYLFWFGQCLKDCPKGTYPAASNCSSCPLECKACISDTACTEYTDPLYGVCEKKCPSGFYPDFVRQGCFGCDKVCEECYDPTAYECVRCNIKAGYVKNDFGACDYIKCTAVIHDNTQADVCIKHCPEGTLAEMGNEGVRCVECHSSCKTCSGPSQLDCIVCRKNFIMTRDSTTAEELCIPYPPGTINKPNVLR
eukprot:TRINITY_DN8378_c0_g7_i1.p1 TRINITY_DN8378_c0_g7~~TRINITY_DN8378_c0_g7_i1.p1  ORF type:complete len:286 (+),score=19.52 TRINITY_DN8378_c0_g7_i1:73-930(+)